MAARIAQDAERTRKLAILQIVRSFARHAAAGPGGGGAGLARLARTRIHCEAMACMMT
jgi:hypothetical protein